MRELLAAVVTMQAVVGAAAKQADILQLNLAAGRTVKSRSTHRIDQHNRPPFLCSVLLFPSLFLLNIFY